MKISKRQLKRIIKEERQKLIKEASMEQSYNYANDLVQDAIQELAETFSEGQLGDGALDAKMDGNTILYELLTAAANRAMQMDR